MQASMDLNSLKHVIKALTCLAKYGEDVVMYTTSESLTFSATNMTASAYCRFKYNRPFFSRFHAHAMREGDALGPQGQVNAKSLLAILKHRTVEKSAEKCELAIVEGGEHEANDEEEYDSLESKLIVRLHCKHGVVKTHRLLLHSTELSSPSMIDSPDESRLTIAPKALRDLIDHFPFSKGPKYDPKLIWKFEEEDVFLRGQEMSVESEAKGLATELSISASEFEVYDVFNPPVTICFHIKEFQSTLVLAEQLGLNLIIRFLNPMSPIFIEIEGDLADTLFVVSTSQIIDPSNGNHPAQRPPHPNRVVDNPKQQPNRHKRELEQDTGDNDDDSLYQIRQHDHRDSRATSAVSETLARKRPVKAATRTDRASLARDLREPGPSTPNFMPPPSFVRNAAAPSSFSVQRPTPPPPLPSTSISRPLPRASVSPPAPKRTRGEPLFLPGSQLSQAAETAIRESGLGIENMDAEELAAMLLEEGEEVEGSQAHHHGNSGGTADVSMRDQEEHEEEVDELAGDVDEDEVMDEARAQRSDSFDLYYDETETQFGPTQGPSGSAGSKVSWPLLRSVHVVS
ncbi:Rad9-domain-containing protein [Cytidiella melzeri]|nr:Rad9-domain-containing protein [Cytidiella melzeri]